MEIRYAKNSSKILTGTKCAKNSSKILLEIKYAKRRYQLKLVGTEIMVLSIGTVVQIFKDSG